MILRIISAVHGQARDAPAGAIRDFYLLSGEDIKKAPKLLPWSLLIQYPRDPRHAECDADAILAPLGLEPRDVWCVPSNRRATELKTLMDTGFLDNEENVAALIPADTRRKQGKTELCFFRPWAFSKTFVVKKGQRVQESNLRKHLQDFLYSAGVWVILDGKEPASMCSVCPDQWRTLMGDCTFPEGGCFANWREYA